MATYLTLQVRPVPGKGRGVFATQTIYSGETIETADVIVIDSKQRPLLEVTVLDHYLFAWGPEELEGALALGYGSLYNHSTRPNARHTMNVENKSITFTALRDIAIDEEITINYLGESSNSRPLWFTPATE